MASYWNSKYWILIVVLCFLCLIQVECRTKIDKSNANSFNLHNLKQEYESQSENQKTQDQSSVLQPKVLFFPDEAPFVGQELITISKDDPAEFSSISTSNSVKPVQTIQSRIGSKFYKFKKQFGGGGGGGGGGSGNNGGNGEHGNNQLQPFSDQDILQRIGSVLGIAGLGILFIAEVSSSFGAPILIPFFAIPLGLIVLLRLAYSNEMLAATMGNGGSNPHECLYFCS